MAHCMRLQLNINQETNTMSDEDNPDFVPRNQSGKTEQPKPAPKKSDRLGKKTEKKSAPTPDGEDTPTPDEA